MLDSFDTAEIAIDPLMAAENVRLALKPRSRDELASFMILEATLGIGVARQQNLRSRIIAMVLAGSTQGHLLAFSPATKLFGDVESQLAPKETSA